MNWYDSVFELIDLRSFSNLWFWIALAVMWSTTSHWVLGVPWDMAVRARKTEDEQSIQDLEDMVRINTNRLLYIARQTGLLLTGFACFILTALFMLGFVYDNEFSQALFLLGMPMSLVGLLSIGTAHTIQQNDLHGDALFRRMYRHRMITQVIGTFSIFATAMWGMLQNMTSGALGG